MMNMEFERKLTIPKDTTEMYPVTKEMEQIVADRAEEIRKIFAGEEDKLILIIGRYAAICCNS